MATPEQLVAFLQANNDTLEVSKTFSRVLQEGINCSSVLNHKVRNRLEEVDSKQLRMQTQYVKQVNDAINQCSIRLSSIIDQMKANLEE